MARFKMTKTKLDSIYWYKHNGKKKYAYRYKYYDKYKVRHEKSKQGYNTIEEAERALIEVKAAILDGMEELVINQNLRLGKWLDYWYEKKHKRWEVTTAASKKSAIDNHLKPILGDYPLNKLTNLTVQQLVDTMKGKDLAVTTVKKVVNVLKYALNDAVRENVIKKVPFSKLDFSKVKENPKRETLQINDLSIVLQKINEEHITRKAALMTLLTTGIRAGELSSIRFKDIDFKAKTIAINETRNYLKLNGGDTKTKNSKREISISDTLYDVLLEYRTWLFSILAEEGTKITDDTFFFYSNRRKPAHPTYGSYVVSSFGKKNGIENLTAHIFRHTYASILIAEKVPVTTVAQLIGDTPETVISTYAHSLKEQEIKAVNIFDKIINPDDEKSKNA